MVYWHAECLEPSLLLNDTDAERTYTILDVCSISSKDVVLVESFKNVLIRTKDT